MNKRIVPKKTVSTIRTKIIRHLREWHRRLGIIAAFFLIFLSITGIGLNHTESLALGHRPISNAWLLAHYGINPPKSVQFYQQQQLSVTDGYVWLGEQLLNAGNEPVIAIGQFQRLWLVLSKSQLSLYDESGALVDQLNSSSGLPTNITAMSINGEQLIVNTESGYYQSDADLLEWQSINTLIEPVWIVSESANSDAISHAQRRFQSQFLTLERIIVDAHSGRIFGTVGVIFMDLVAIILLMLSASGIYIWLRYLRSKR